jgi:hypothetical protein
VPRKAKALGMIDYMAYEGIEHLLTFIRRRTPSQEELDAFFTNLNQDRESEGLPKITYQRGNYDILYFISKKVPLVLQNDKGLYQLADEGGKLCSLLGTEAFKERLFGLLSIYSKQNFIYFNQILVQLRLHFQNIGSKLTRSEWDALARGVCGNNTYAIKGSFALLEGCGVLAQTQEGDLVIQRRLFQDERALDRVVLKKIIELKEKGTREVREVRQKLVEDLPISEDEFGSILERLETGREVFIKRTRGGDFIE